MHGLLRKHGLAIEKAELGGYVVQATDSELRVKASSVFRDNFSGKANRAQTEKQLGPWEPPKRFIELRDAEQTYQPEVKRDPQQRAERRAARANDRERLKKEYRAYRSGAEKQMKVHATKAGGELRELMAKQRRRREELRQLQVKPLARQAMRSVLAAEGVRERAVLKQRQIEERAALRPKRYRDWVAERAAQGDRAATSQWRGFVYRERRLAMELGVPGLVLGSIQGPEEDKHTWSDTPDLGSLLQRHQLLSELRTLEGMIDHRTGHVSYQIAGRQALLDAGKKIWVLENREATVLAGLEMAVQKFGSRRTRGSRQAGSLSSCGSGSTISVQAGR